MFDFNKNPFTLSNHNLIDQTIYDGIFDNHSSCIDNIFYMSRDVGPVVPFGTIKGYVEYLLSGLTNPYLSNTLAWHHYEWGRECARKNTYMLDNQLIEDYAYG
jgi:hypothetical protein